MPIIDQFSSMLDPITDQEDIRPGISIGEVTDLNDPEKFGRVKCKLLSVEESESDIGWAYVAAPFAGKEYGIHFLPCVGDLVIVAFDGGDVNRPFIIGSLWGSKTTRPVTINNGVNDTYIIKTPNKSSITFNDKEGKESIEVKTKNGSKLAIDEEKNTLTLGDKNAKNEVEINAKTGAVTIKGEKTIKLVAGSAEIVLDAAGKITIKAPQMVQLEGAQINAKANGTLELKASGQTTLEAGGVTIVKGGVVKIN